MRAFFSRLFARRRLMLAFAHILGFLLLFVLFVYLTFPTDAVRDVLARTLSDRLGRPVQIEELDLRGLSGVELSGVQLSLMPRPAASSIQPDPTAPQPPPIPIALDEVEVGGDLLALARGEEGRVSARVAAYGGTFEVREAHVTPDRIDVTGVGLEGLDLRASPLLRVLIPWDVRGKVEARAKLTLERDKAAAGSKKKGKGKTVLRLTTAKLSLTVTEAKVRTPVVPSRTYGDFKFTDADLGTLEVEAELGPAKGLKGLERRYPDRALVLMLRELDLRGADVMATLEDEATIVWIRPTDPLVTGRVAASFAVRLADTYLDKEVVKGGRKEKPNAGLRMVLKNDPRLRAATRNGWLGFRCTGTIQKPGCLPSLPSAKVARVGPFAPRTKPEADKKKETKRIETRQKPAPSRAAPPARPTQPGPGRAVGPSVALPVGAAPAEAEEEPEEEYEEGEEEEYEEGEEEEYEEDEEDEESEDGEEDAPVEEGEAVDEDSEAEEEEVDGEPEEE